MVICGTYNLQRAYHRFRTNKKQYPAALYINPYIFQFSYCSTVIAQIQSFLEQLIKINASEHQIPFIGFLLTNSFIQTILTLIDKNNSRKISIVDHLLKVFQYNEQQYRFNEQRINLSESHKFIILFNAKKKN